MESLSRTETLQVLSCMGVDLPPNTKLSDEALDKRLKQAVDAAQLFSQCVPNSLLQPPSLTSWPSLRPGEVSLTARPVLQAIMRGNLQEVMLNMQLRAQGGELNLFKDPFMDLRQTVMSIAKAWDDGQRWCVMQDPAGENSAINLRFLSVYELDADTPVIVVLYQSVTKEKPLPGLRWIEAQKAKMGGQGQFSNIRSTALEQKLMLKVLAMNAKRLSSEFKPKKDTSELGFKASFLLPIGPLGFEDLGSLNRDTGCVLCGKKTKNRCSACESASYCGQECQKADWQDHKQTCRSLKGGRWCTIPVAPTIPGAEGMYSVTANRFSTRSGVGSRVHKADDNTPYPNIHGERPFIIKIQIGLGQPQNHMMIYDRQRSVEMYFLRPSSPALFHDFEEEMAGPRGGYRGVKMYRWAKRTGDWQLSICLDRAPATEIKW